MPDRIRAAVRHTGDILPDDPAAITRCIMDSLAAGYARTLAEAERLSGRTVNVVHIVGGGSQNKLLCQLTADATGKRVIAGPVEATALGNILIQARAAGKVSGGLPDLRRLAAASAGLQTFTPQQLSRLWLPVVGRPADAARDLYDIGSPKVSRRVRTGQHHAPL
jgi:rhamnulokinase